MEKERYNQETLLTFLEIGKLLTSTLNPDETLRHIMEKGHQMIRADNWSLLLKNDTSDTLVFEVVVGIRNELLKGVEIKLNEGIAGWVAKTGEPAFIPDVQSDARFNNYFDKITGYTTKSIICLPLKINGKVTGVIEILNVLNPHVFDNSEITGLELLADYAAIAIRNSRYIKKIETMSITDEYTGLLNARYMHSYLDKLFQDKKPKEAISVIFADMDEFKDIVDNYGHLSGSDVLKEVGSAIKEVLPHEYTLIKYGGDEYVVILPDTEKTEAIKIMKLLDNKIKNTKFLINENLNIKTSASFGIATYPVDAPDKKGLLIAADNELFNSKKANRNKG